MANEVTFAQIVWILLSCAGLAMLIALAAHLLGKFRGSAEEEQLGASELLTKFRDLHSEGELSDVEFRTIKTLLAERLQNEIKDTGEKG